MSFEPITFKTADGTTLRGNFHKAPGAKTPVVVMTGGLGMTKSNVGMTFIDAFLKAGISCFPFDARGFGDSEGLPRQEINLLDQAENYVDAITAVRQLPGVDPDRIGIWGIGHGGATVMIAGAIDPRVKAIVSHSAFFSGAHDAKGFPAGALDRARAERERLATTGSTERVYVQHWPSSIENARGEGEKVWMAGEAAFGLAQGVDAQNKEAGTPWENKMTLQSYYLIEKCESYWYLEKVTQPYLHVVHEDDPFAPNVALQRAAFNRIGDNGEFVVIPPNTNKDRSTFFSASIDLEADFLKKALA